MAVPKIKSSWKKDNVVIATRAGVYTPGDKSISLEDVGEYHYLS